MIIVKYGDAKKLESAKRWKCKCSKCGCEVLLDKDDARSYRTDVDSGGHHFTKFYWTCPYCETEIYYDEYDKIFFRITKLIEDFAVYHDGLCAVLAVLLAGVSLGLIIWGSLSLLYKYYDNKYDYRIEYQAFAGSHCTDWAYEIEERDVAIIYTDEDDHRKKVDLDTAVVTNLKEEE